MASRDRKESLAHTSGENKRKRQEGGGLVLRRAGGIASALAMVIPSARAEICRPYRRREIQYTQ